MEYAEEIGMDIETYFKTTSNLLLIPVGPTQSGKSTIVGLLAADEVEKPKVGNGDGSSVTQDVHVYPTKLGHQMLDIPGYDDNGLRFTEEACGEQVAQILLEAENSRLDCDQVVFLIVNSPAGDSSRLAPTLNWLVKSFGENAADSAVVLMTKLDRLDAWGDGEKKNRINKDSEEAYKLFGADSKHLRWRSKRGENLLTASDTILKRQLKELWKAVNATKPMPIEAVQGLEARVQARAEQLEKDNPQFVEEEGDEPRYVEVRHEDVRDRSAEGAVIGAGAGMASFGAIAYFAEMSTVVAAASTAAPVAISMTPVIIAAAAGAAIVALAGAAIGLEFQRTVVTVKLEPRLLTTVVQVHQGHGRFLSQAREEIREEIRQSVKHRLESNAHISSGNDEHISESTKSTGNATASTTTNTTNSDDD